MAKNENNSHAFIRKMIENIKQTKDGQCPDDPKINEVCVILKKCFVFFSCGFMRLILSQQLLLSSIMVQNQRFATLSNEIDSKMRDLPAIDVYY